MSKFLLTACAFGLLLSSAFADDRSPERLREEGNQIFAVEGLRKERATRVVASGKSQRVGFFFALNPDCSSMGEVEVRVTKETEHGKVDTATTTLYPGYPKENIVPSAMSTRFAECKSITSRQKNTSATIH